MTKPDNDYLLAELHTIIGIIETYGKRFDDLEQQVDMLQSNVDELFLSTSKLDYQ